jgi:hypothetical protein
MAVIYESSRGFPAVPWSLSMILGLRSWMLQVAYPSLRSLRIATDEPLR